MKYRAIIAASAVVICGAAITWQFAAARAAQRNLMNAAKSLRIRAEHGDANAQYELARLYYQGKGVQQSYDEAFLWYRKAADEGNAKAQYGVGFMYQEGRGAPQDLATALEWYRKAAYQGYARAQEALGNAYYRGQGVPQDYATALSWYRKAADQGHARAQNYLGYMYGSGQGVARDNNTAVNWYRKSADQGNAVGEGGLGYAYRYGIGVPQDNFEAARWYRKAAQQGDKYGRNGLASLNLRFTAGDKIWMAFSVLLGSVFLLATKANIRERKQQKITFIGILILLKVGLDIYWRSHFGILLALSIVNAFYIGKGLLTGLLLTMLISFGWGKGFKPVLGICCMAFAAFNIYAVTHYDLGHLPACPRPFYSINGLLLGLAISSGIFLWLDSKNTGGKLDEGIGSENAIESGTGPLPN